MRRSATVVLVISVAISTFLHTQTTTISSPTIRQFFDAADENASTDWVEFDKVEAQIPTASAKEISDALPSIFRVWRQGPATRKNFAAAALIAVSFRADSAQLLSEQTAGLADLLNSSDTRFQGAAVAICGAQKPHANREVIPALLAFVRRHDRAASAQAAALSVLLRNRPDDSDVNDAVEQFLGRPLDRETRIGALNAVSSSRTKDARTRAAVIRSLDDSHPGVKVAAINAVTTMGQEAVLQAEPLLQKLAADSSGEPTEVKFAAQKALRAFGRSKP